MKTLFPPDRQDAGNSGTSGEGTGRQGLESGSAGSGDRLSKHKSLVLTFGRHDVELTGVLSLPDTHSHGEGLDDGISGAEQVATRE